MKIFGPLYERTLGWARHRHAPAYLTGLSFVEAIIFPVMPEVMLAPMCVAKPKSGFWFATLSLAGSMAGALVGYALGHYAFEALKPVFASLVLGGFMPIPMKVFTWASGIVGVPLLPYFLAMAVGRGKRVYLLALVIRIGGEKAEATLRRYIEPIGWLAIVAVAAIIGWLVWRSHGA